MMTKRWPIIGLFFLLLISIGCQSNEKNDELGGRFTLWHSWSQLDAVHLEEALAQFEEIYPEVHIVPVAIPKEQILEEFTQMGNDGLGPDLLIGDDAWVGELVDAGLIRPFVTDQITITFFNTRNRNLVVYEDELYGLPMSLAPFALYYNKNMVSDPPNTLDELLDMAAAGNGVAFVPRFVEAYWGIQAFGEGLFDANGRFTLAESGFTEWLAWLEAAQTEPGVILNVDDESLLKLFATEQIAFYVAEPNKQHQIAARMNEENPFEFGVVPLPQGPEGIAGPLLKAETILFYTHASEAQTDIADTLAYFLVNEQQSVRFLRETDRVPANPSVRVDSRIYPIANGFSQQARTALVLPNDIPNNIFVTAGDRAYISVLSGAATPEEVVCQFGLEVAETMALADHEMDLPEGCTQAQE